MNPYARCFAAAAMCDLKGFSLMLYLHSKEEKSSQEENKEKEMKNVTMLNYCRAVNV